MVEPLKVLFADSIAEGPLQPLTAAGVQCDVRSGLNAEDLPEAISGYQGLVVRSTKVTDATIAAANGLQFIVRAGAGVDNIDTDSASKCGVYVCNVPGRNAVAVAELTMGLLLSIDRRIADNTAELRAGTWNKTVYSNADGLLGKTIGIVGLGDIGLAVAKRAKSFGMIVTAARKDGRSEKVQQRIRSIGIRIVDTQEDLLAEADVVSIHVPKADSTVGLVDAAFLAHMKPNAILLNTSRGEVLEEGALLVALNKGLRAGLDVFANEPKASPGTFASDVASHPNVVGTHHIGASTTQAQNSVAQGTVETIQAFLAGAPINVVNMHTQPTGTASLIIKHHDRVGVLASVFELLRSAGVNVQQMENRLFAGEGGAAVASIHVSELPSAAGLTELNQLPNILDVAVLSR